MNKVCLVSFCKSFKCSSAVSFWPFLYLKQRVSFQVRVLSLHATQNFANSDNLCNTTVTARDRELLISALNLLCQYAQTGERCKLLDNTFLKQKMWLWKWFPTEKSQLSPCSIREVIQGGWTLGFAPRRFC